MNIYAIKLEDVGIETMLDILDAIQDDDSIGCLGDPAVIQAMEQEAAMEQAREELETYMALPPLHKVTHGTEFKFLATCF